MKTQHKYYAAIALLAVVIVLVAPDTSFASNVIYSLPFAIGIGMTTLAANKPRAYELGERNDFPVIASEIIYEGAAVGLVAGTGHARPLVGGDRFVGIAEATSDNSAGAAAAIMVRVVDEGEIQLAVTGAVITDVGQPVYATDDDTFVLNSVGGSFVGYVSRFVSAGVAVVAFEPECARDLVTSGYTNRATISVNTTLDATYSGKTIVVDTDGVIITLPAVAAGLYGVKIVNGGAFGTVGLEILPNAADMIMGPGITGADTKYIINTKATARRGDFVVLDSGDADGYLITEMVGIWAREA